MLSKIKYFEITLTDFLEEVGVEEFERISSDFSCEKNRDIEEFLKEKAVIFERNDISRTSLIFAYGSDKKAILLAYYSIAQKPFHFSEGVSRGVKKQIAGHQFFLKGPLPALLLGQLGKNFSEKAHSGSLIKGEDILYYAFKKMKAAYLTLPFKVIYLECLDKKELRDFYEKHGFTLHANHQGKPYRNDDNDDLLIYLTSSSILNEID